MAMKYDWNIIKKEYEAGKPLNRIHRELGCSRAAIRKHAVQEGWKKPEVTTLENISHDELYAECPRYRFVVDNFRALYKQCPGYKFKEIS